MPETTESRITREVRGHVLLIGLNRPAKKNAFDIGMLRELGAAVTELDASGEFPGAMIFVRGPGDWG
jgi:enoyl-CoA hydratase/carnithine racemase